MTETKKVDFKLTREGLVKIEHKDTKGQGTCLPEALPVWLDSGWSVVDPATVQEAAVIVRVDEEKQTGTAGPAPKEK